MPQLPILRYPDPRLAVSCAPVTDFDDVLARLADDLVLTLEAVNAIGLTAAHAGVALRVVAMSLPPDRDVRVMVNPEVLSASPETTVNEEGSVSMPGVTAPVTRPALVTVAWRDVLGDPHEESFAGFAAAVVLHEIDQLDGIFFLQRLSRLKRERLVKRWRRTGEPD